MKKMLYFCRAVPKNRSFFEKKFLAQTTWNAGCLARIKKQNQIANYSQDKCSAPPLKTHEQKNA
ncbi:MAG: hypothetical protein IJ621_01925 [Paludibacteraceae bacterium]|nr:hypothetical protein [Paludibacteraceae bacterium]